MSELVEILADLEHERWSGWMAYLFSRCAETSDGALLIPQEWAQRWKLQAMTHYAELTEKEKDSDRAEVKKTLQAITDFATKNI